MNNVLALLSFLVAAIFLYFGTHVLLLDRREQKNRIFFWLCLYFTIWSFGYTFVFIAATEEARWFWYRVGAIGWCFFPPLLLCFALSLTGHKINLSGWNKIFFAALFIPGPIFYYYVLNDFLLITGFKYTPLGICEVMMPQGFLYWAYVVYFSSIMLLCPIFFAHWGIKTKIKREKRQALLIIATWVPTVLIGSAVNFILPSMGIATPAVAYLGIIIWFGGIWWAIIRYRFMVFTAALAAEIIVANITDMVVLTDTSGIIIEANKSANKLIRAKGKNILGRHFSQLFVEQKLLRDKYNEVQDLSSIYLNGEFNLKSSSGEIIPVYLTLSAVNDKMDEELGIALIIRDLRQENELRKAKESAEEATRTKSEFLANMSHELRTPLTAVIGFSEVMQDEIFGELNDKQKEYIDNILGSGNHLLNLINDILDLSKVEAGKMELKPEQIVLRDILNSSVIMVTEKAKKHSIRLNLDIKQEADIKIDADERKFKQILFNLLSNAVKFTGDGSSVSVRASLVKVPDGLEAGQLDHYNTLAAGDYIEVAVEDTGIGIKPEDMQKLFAEFSQLESPYQKTYEGTGLGLALTKRLVQLHGGEIWVASEFGKGSTFAFAVPVKQLPIPLKGLDL